ncbi:hypothetical protein MAE02_71600 [Microvirga aerophila]|uniref:Uncharacterized protein n=1 Tax=Microvirga aerophila TaxID=670291 RepID=A0A512C5G5_9HYPH|nr:hypothetical protein MAE02_71600 [Microvirga aerophila]
MRGPKGAPWRHPVRSDDPHLAGRTAYRKTPMALDPRLDRGKLNCVMFADGPGGKIGRQPGAAARALVWLMVDEAISIRAHGAAVTFMSRLGTTGLGLIPTLLAIRCGRL